MKELLDGSGFGQSDSIQLIIGIGLSYGLSYLLGSGLYKMFRKASLIDILFHAFFH